MKVVIFAAIAFLCFMLYACLVAAKDADEASDEYWDKHKKGFTLIETLVVVGILTVLGSIGIDGVVELKYKINQKEADCYAENFFISQTNDLIRIRTSGRLSDFNKKNSDILEDPEGYDGDGLAYYITEEDGLNYLVEYDKWSAFVYGVFYSNDGDFSFYTNTKADDVYRNNTMTEFIDYTKGNSNRQIISYYGGGVLSLHKPPQKEVTEEEKKEENKNRNLYLADGFVYWEQYEDLTYGVYYVYDFINSKSHAGDYLSYDKIVIADGYGIGISKNSTHHLYMDRKCNAATATEYSSFSASFTHDLESNNGYLIKFPKEWTDESEKTAGNFYSRLGFWYTDTAVSSPALLVNPLPIYVNMRTAKNGVCVGKGNTNPIEANGGNLSENIIIRSARQLYDLSLYFTCFVASAETVWCVQECDIDYSKYEWGENTTTCFLAPSQYPIGYGDSILDKSHKNTFMCNYEGNGHYISGLNVKAIGGYSGLFSILRDYPYRDSKGNNITTGIVQNLTIKNSTFEDAKYKGAICGQMQKNTQISNCFADIALYGTKDSTAVVK